MNKMQVKQRSWRQSFFKALQNVKQALPLIIGVLLLFSLYLALLPKDLLQKAFSGKIISDTFIGAVMGSIFSGNAVNSYIIGGELLKNGVSLYAVTAFLVSWVTVGLVQFPAEAAMLGKGFALRRNLLSFLLSFFAAVATVLTIQLLG
ncbi:permease [Caldithrix abyssi]